MSANSQDQTLVAAKTVEIFVARAIRLYEQEPGEACASSQFGLYVRRWVRWVHGGVASHRSTRAWASALNADALGLLGTVIKI